MRIYFYFFLLLPVITDIVSAIKESKESGSLAEQILKNFNLP